MATHVLAEVLEHSQAEDSERLVIIILADHASRDTREAEVSMQLICSQTRKSERTVRYALRRLEQMKEISVVRGRGRGNCSVYKISHLPIRKGDNLSPFRSAENQLGVAAALLNAQLDAVEKVTDCHLLGELKGAKTAPFIMPEKGQVASVKGANSDIEKGQIASASTSVNYSVISQQQQTLLARSDDVIVEGLNPNAWKLWIDYRKKIRKPLKPVSIPAAQRKLAAFGSRQLAVVEHCIANGYQGLFPPAGGKDGAARRRTFDEIHQEQSERIENLEASYGTAGAIPGTANRLD